MLGFELDLFFYEDCIWLGLGLRGFFFFLSSFFSWGLCVGVVFFGFDRCPYASCRYPFILSFTY
jgi:hypothetical protein